MTLLEFNNEVQIGETVQISSDHNAFEQVMRGQRDNLNDLRREDFNPQFVIPRIILKQLEFKEDVEVVEWRFDGVIVIRLR